MAAVRPMPGAPPNAPNSAQDFYLHTDHLGTPRVALDTAGRVRWRWMGGETSGLSPAENAPTAGLSELNISLRLPGQQYDGFVGLHYNYFRDYDPTVGRYVQSDPIGLAGGINTYAYVTGNPISYADPRGLDNPGMGPYSPPINSPAMVTYAQYWAGSKSQGKCARYVRYAIEEAGGDMRNRPADAADYARTLVREGFVGVSSEGYAPRAGDIVVYPRVPGHGSGHIAIYTGSSWVSDFRQRSILVSPDYATAQPEYFRPNCSCE